MDEFPLFHAHGKNDAMLRNISADTWKLLLRDSISPIPLHKTLELLDTLNEYQDERFIRHERLALAKAIVSGISNLEFGPEVGVGVLKVDYPVVETWLNAVRVMSDDLRVLQSQTETKTVVIKGDSRQLHKLLEPISIEAVITSPPYPNEKDYTRTTRLESVLLGFITNKARFACTKANFDTIQY